MTEERLGNLGVLAVHGFDHIIETETIRKIFEQKNPRKMGDSSLLFDD